MSLLNPTAHPLGFFAHPYHHAHQSTSKSTHLIDSLNASYEWPYCLCNGQAIVSYNSSVDFSFFLATWVKIESTAFPFSYCSSHLTTSSAETRRFDKSM